jgi:hypothetical protein
MKWRADLHEVHSYVEAPSQLWHSYITSWRISCWHMIARRCPLIPKSLQGEVILRKWLHCHTAILIIFIHYLLAGGSEPFLPALLKAPCFCGDVTYRSVTCRLLEIPSSNALNSVFLLRFHVMRRSIICTLQQVALRCSDKTRKLRWTGKHHAWDRWEMHLKF